MCLAVPGQVVSIQGNDPMTRSGRVSFGGVIREVCLAYVPEVQVDDYVIVHVGFALSIVDPEQAQQTLQDLSHLAAGEPPDVHPSDRTRASFVVSGFPQFNAVYK